MTHFPTNQIPLVLQTLIKSPMNFCGTSSGFQSKVESFSLKHVIYYPPLILHQILYIAMNLLISYIPISCLSSENKRFVVFYRFINCEEKSILKIDDRSVASKPTYVYNPMLLHDFLSISGDISARKSILVCFVLI